MKDCIRDFIDSWKVYDKEYYPSQVHPPWSTRFRDAGYFSVPLTDNNLLHQWQDVHRWCEHEFGERHYTWTGSIFWFENDRDAMWFALRWS